MGTKQGGTHLRPLATGQGLKSDWMFNKIWPRLCKWHGGANKAGKHTTERLGVVSEQGYAPGPKIKKRVHPLFMPRYSHNLGS